MADVFVGRIAKDSAGLERSSKTIADVRAALISLELVVLR